MPHAQRGPKAGLQADFSRARGTAGRRSDRCCRRRPREPRAPPSPRGPSAVTAPTAPVAVGSDPLRRGGLRVDGLAFQPRRRSARDGSRLAPPGLPALLAMEVQANPLGRPKLDAEIRHLIHRMARDNPTWGRRRIRTEVALLGYVVAELTVNDPHLRRLLRSYVAYYNTTRPHQALDESQDRSRDVRPCRHECRRPRASARAGGRQAA
jgi:hypothetical protein